MTATDARLTGAQSFLSNRRNWLLIALFIIALIFPFVTRSYYLSLGIEVLIYAVFAMSLDLLLGYTGLASFGHAAFFGIGAYITAYIASRNDLAFNITNNLFIILPAVLIIIALVAVAIGFFALRTSGIYFLMITLAFAQMLYSIAISWSSVTGGSDGIPGVARPAIGIGPISYAFTSRESYYYLVLAFFLLSWWLLRRIVDSPFGWTLKGIRENEARMRALGYNTFRYKMASFILAAAFAGVAGMLLAFFFRHAPPNYLYWTVSGQVLIMLVVGGSGTLTGPILGAVVIRLFPQVVSSYTERWEMLMGIMFVLFVMFAPKGIMGIIRSVRTKSSSFEGEGTHRNS